MTLNVAQQTLLEETSLLVAPGDKVVIRGASGSGKSSLLKSVAGAIPLEGGSVRVNGDELSAETLASIRSHIAFIGQEPVLGAESVRDALLLPFTFKAHRGNQPDEGRIAELLGRLKLPPGILGKESKRISGGEKQRIAIARALLLNKRIFLADEVTSALDPESKAAVMGELFRPGTTLLSVSHDPDWLGGCNRVVEIDNKKLRESVADPQIGIQKAATKNPDTGGGQ
jgi:putative ABC transport system ATP-binding protein